MVDVLKKMDPKLLLTLVSEHCYPGPDEQNLRNVVYFLATNRMPHFFHISSLNSHLIGNEKTYDIS